MPNIPPRAPAPRPPLAELSAEAWLHLLHPAASHGRPALLWFDAEDPRCSCADSASLELALPALLDHRAYLSMNRFRSRRNTRDLVALNALYADLDWYKTESWRASSDAEVETAVLEQLQRAGVPEPSLLLRSGRGLVAIWLINEMPVQALGRWKAAMRSLTELLAIFGADPASKDPCRVFRLPESRNEKSGKRVCVSGGSGLPHDFDMLADVVHISRGRPPPRAVGGRACQPRDAVTRKGRRSHAVGLAPGRQIPADPRGP